MPVLKDKVENIERFYLPSTSNLPEMEQAFVDMDTSPTVTADIIGLDTKGHDVEIGIRMLVARIKGWNFTDAAGNELEVNFDNVKKLDIGDFTFLAAKLDSDIEGLSQIEKKT